MRPGTRGTPSVAMAFRFERTFLDDSLMVVFEEEENLDTGALELATTFCDSRVSLEAWREAEREALLAWRAARPQGDVLVFRPRTKWRPTPR
jgi:hypothetical protein